MCIRDRPSYVPAGALIESWGTLKPPQTAEQNTALPTKVYWERFSGGIWRPSYSAFATLYRNTSSETKYGVRMAYAAGKWRVRAMHEDGDHAETTSSWATFTALPPTLTPPAVPSRVRAGARIESWGTLKPRAEAESPYLIKVYCQRYHGGRWNAVYEEFARSYRNTSSSTRYCAVVRCVAGSFRIRAVHADFDHATVTSSWRRFTAY